MTAPNRGGHPRTPVQCVETGQVFPSIAAAAASAYVDRRRIREALQHGSAAGGYHWAAPGAAAPADPALPPAEGEVDRLVAWLEQQPGGLGRRAACARVAELLRQQAAELERLRQREAVAWLYRGEPDYAGHPLGWRENWQATTSRQLAESASRPGTPIPLVPAHALPLPSEEERDVPIRLNEGRVQRGNGSGGPTTPKPPIKPKPQFPPTYQ